MTTPDEEPLVVLGVDTENVDDHDPPLFGASLTEKLGSVWVGWNCILVIVTCLVPFAVLAVLVYENDDCGWDPPYTVDEIVVNGTYYHSERHRHPIAHPPAKCHFYTNLLHAFYWAVGVTLLLDIPAGIWAYCWHYCFKTL